MLAKIIGVIIATFIVASIEPVRAFAIPFFIVALAAVFVIEGVRVVPRVVAEATAAAVNMVAEAIGREGGLQAANLKVAERYIEAFAQLAKTNNTLIIPSNVSDIAGIVSSAMTVLDRTRLPGAGRPAAAT